MKLLFDENLSFRLCIRLSDIFPDSSQVKLLSLEQADDLQIWNHAKINNLTIVTLDSDFADLSAVYGQPPKVIWLRCGNQRVITIESILRKHLPVIRDFEIDPDAACIEIF